MKLCPNCKSTFPDDANFCPEETCATANGPQRLQAAPDPAAAAAAKPRFQMLTRIGGGGTGEVWKAHDNEAGSDVAYKIVAADALPNAAAFSRAERELKQM